MLGCYDIYLWNEMMRPDIDVVFVSDARNVVASYFICQQMCRLLKAVRLRTGIWADEHGTCDVSKEPRVHQLSSIF